MTYLSTGLAISLALFQATTPSAGDVPGILADGHPWAMVARDGKRAALTLYPDGRGTLAGPVKLSIRWRIEGARFCLRMGLLLGTRCVDRFEAIPGGWRGVSARGDGFTLTRS